MLYFYDFFILIDKIIEDDIIFHVFVLRFIPYCTKGL